MRVPIPPGHEAGDRLVCIRVWWPDDARWLAILRGLLSYPTRGRFWDERTGRIKDAQAIGREIMGATDPFVLCGGGGPACEPGDMSRDDIIALLAAMGVGGGAAGDEENEMGQVVTEVEVVNGKLRVHYGHCCFEDIDVCAACGSAPGEDVPGEPGEPEEGVDQICRDAHAYAQTAQKFGNELWDLLTTELDVWDAVEELRQRWPFLQRGTWSVWEFLVEKAVQNAGLRALSLEVDLTDADTEQYKCLLYGAFDDVPGISQAEHDVARDTLAQAAFGGSYEGEWVRDCLEFARRECLDANVRAYTHASEPSCECDGVGDGTIGDVVWSAEPGVSREDGTYTLLRRYNGGLSAEHEFVTDTGSFKALTINHEIEISGGEEIGDMLIVLEPISPTADQLLNRTWKTDNCGVVDTDSMYGELSDVDRISQDVTVANGRVHLNEVWSVDKTSLAWNSGEARSCPQNQLTPKSYRWRAHIARINGEPTGVISIPDGA